MDTHGSSGRRKDLGLNLAMGEHDAGGSRDRQQQKESMDMQTSHVQTSKKWAIQGRMEGSLHAPGI
jgi:hypothetical protein